MQLEVKDHARIAAGIVLMLVIAVIVSSLVLNFMNKDIHGSPISILGLLKDFSINSESQKTAVVIFGGVVALCLGAMVWFTYSHTTTRYGTSHFQTRKEMKKNDFLTDLDQGGLIFGKLAPPPKEPRGKPLEIVKQKPAKSLKEDFISAPIYKFPQCLLVAPTRAGKTVGYIIPNSLLADGSLVVLDVKGEIFKATARARVAMGDEVMRFAPYDFINPSHHYNPLARIAKITNSNQLYAELDKLAENFLVVKGEGSAQNFLGGAKQWFIAACLRAIECGNPTLTKVHELMYGDGEQVGLSDSDRYNQIAAVSNNKIVRREFSNYGNLDPKIRQSYSQVMSDSGLKQWANPQIQAVTRRDDIRFDDIREKRKSIYVVVHSDDISPLNAVVRLFFTELIASLRQTSSEHDSDLGQVFIMLDEFDQLGYMPIVHKAMKQLAGHGARTTVVTQSIPGLKSVGYSDAEVDSLIAGCEMKLYISPNDHATTEEISKALGTRTGFKASYSYTLNDFSSKSVNLSTEQLPLLTSDQIRRLPKEKILLMPEGHLPIMADRIVYYQDELLKKVYENQSGPYPYPSVESQRIDQLEAHVAQVSAENQALKEAHAEMRAFRAEKAGTASSAPRELPTEDKAQAATERQAKIEAEVDADRERRAEEIKQKQQAMHDKISKVSKKSA